MKKSLKNFICTALVAGEVTLTALGLGFGFDGMAHWQNAQDIANKYEIARDVNQDDFIATNVVVSQEDRQIYFDERNRCSVEEKIAVCGVVGSIGMLAHMGVSVVINSRKYAWERNDYER